MPGAGVFRAYDAIREVTQSPELGLEMPDLVRTSNMRKYMATMLQALNTTEAERRWVIDYLGHKMDVHHVHYRQTSDVLEHVDIAEMLLIQDMGLVSKYRGKRLADIQIEDMFEVVVDSAQSAGEPVVDSDITALVSSSNITTNEDEFIPDISDEMECEEEGEEEEVDRRKPEKPAKLSTRQKWSDDEVAELLHLFSDDFQTNKLPGQKRIERVIKISKSNSGVIWKRKRDTIKKKLSNMMIKRRAESS